jgi:pimeloyl-ACP methyl ester carboxylesterase
MNPSPETKLTIPLSDGHVAYAKLRGEWSQPLVIFAHGLCGNMDEVLPHELSKSLSAQEYAFLRFNFYDGGQNARVISGTTLETHANDLSDVVAYARQQGADAIHVIGHSYGGLTLLLAKKLPVISGILLDAYHPDLNVFKNAPYMKELEAYVWDEKPTAYVLGKAMVEYDRHLKGTSFLNGHTLSTLIVAAGAGILLPYEHKYHEALKPLTDTTFEVVTDASHNFDTDEHREKVIQIVLAWLTKQPNQDA